jgi:hypothetical protein
MENLFPLRHCGLNFGQAILLQYIRNGNFHVWRSTVQVRLISNENVECENLRFLYNQDLILLKIVFHGKLWFHYDLMMHLLACLSQEITYLINWHGARSTFFFWTTRWARSTLWRWWGHTTHFLSLSRCLLSWQHRSGKQTAFSISIGYFFQKLVVWIVWGV